MSPRRLLAVGLLVLVQSACVSWHIGTASLQYIETESPDDIRITRSSGQMIFMADPGVRADSIAGTVEGFRLSTIQTVPINDVSLLEVRHVERAKTIAVLAGMPISVAALAVFIGLR